MNLILRICFFCLLCACTSANPVNNEPIIGVLAQETLGDYKVVGASFIMAAYVKFVESAGARAALIKVGKPKSYYKEMINQINGLLLPGGNVPITNDTHYTKAITILFDLAKDLNDNGHYFPIWGTCLGHQNLMVLFSDLSILSNCVDEDVALPLNFEADFRSSKMFKSIDDETANIFATENVTINFHHQGIRTSDFTKRQLNKELRIISTNTDIYGVQYISCVEARKYPFYGVQFHPEKNSFVWVFNKDRQHIPHSYDAIRASQYLANFFVGEARKNLHKFKSTKDMEAAISYSYNVTNTVGKLEQANQVYAFHEKLN